MGQLTDMAGIGGCKECERTYCVDIALSTAALPLVYTLITFYSSPSLIQPPAYCYSKRLLILLTISLSPLTITSWGARMIYYYSLN
jgi:hypothetical protein